MMSSIGSAISRFLLTSYSWLTPYAAFVNGDTTIAGAGRRDRRKHVETESGGCRESLFERDTVADFPPLVRLRILLLLVTLAHSPAAITVMIRRRLIVLPRPSRCVTPFVALARSEVASVGNVGSRRLQNAALEVTARLDLPLPHVPNPVNVADQQHTIGGRCTASPSVGKRFRRTAGGLTERNYRTTAPNHGRRLGRSRSERHVVAS